MLTMARVMAEFTTFVSSKPSMNEIAQQLVLSTLSKYELRAAVLYSFDEDGFVTLSGSFGLSSFATNAHEAQSIWRETPAVDAIREDRPLNINSSNDMHSRYPHLLNDNIFEVPLSVWPLKLGSMRMGALQVRLLAPQESDEFIAEFRGISTILSLYLVLRNQERVVNADPRRHDFEGHGRQKPILSESAADYRRDALTNRQLTILSFLVDGLTNPQIAQRIGFSESTVRQETMNIYRFLEVKDRRQAADAAVERRLLRAHRSPGLVARVTT
jgi:DNA-binding CsgD family transcriptional regulator